MKQPTDRTTTARFPAEARKTTVGAGSPLRAIIPLITAMATSCLTPSASAVEDSEKALRESDALRQVTKLARAGALDYEKHIAPIVDKYCTDCHNPVDDEGSIDLEALLTTKEASKYPDLWEMVGKTARMDVMPPPKRKTRPDIRERALLMGWAMQIGHLWDQGIMGTDPGRTTLHRLNRNEYNYTIRDLFGLKIRPADNFPEDSAGEGGFDNDADALFLPALLMENYFEAAVKVSNMVLGNHARRQAFLIGASSNVAGARRVFAHWAPQIYRRPVADDEIERLVSVYQKARKNGKNHVVAIRDPLIMMLVSPSFLYRSELPIAGGGKTVGLTEFELANRLSYFLWASMPDQELFKLANEKKLSDPKVLEQQVMRMLQDEKASTLAMHLGGQWLGWEQLRGSANPDVKKFPMFNFALRVDMYRESSNFFEHLLREDGSVYDLLDSDYSFLNDRLARLYGIKGVTGSHFRKVKLNNPDRGGVLGMGSVLVASSMPLRTSPSLRGAYVLESLLGDKPPSPPMDVEQLPAGDSKLKTLTFRETLDQHRDSPDCRACHALIDPLGFGLENFDAIGRWRTMQNGAKIDTSGVTPEGDSFSGPAELKKLLLKRKDEFTRHAVEKFLSYALGRELTPYDRPVTREIANKVMEENGSMHTLIMSVVTSHPFLNRQNPKK
ncbi:DUF1592 domain-containing protein [Verrucomicrobiaceae bacterium 5K15]|uniref:DUF1592 domain-containing protein n=1 Tax=Oceaniferula flava TaxID=2800421 RepID=A0AAE2SBV6_9BACT|nr:DUF1592 domain-containing protein [Oceaniferula flavus]MBK1855320.1 DUF1592 domain-containing protein [Oceaniferula flavus]MBM1136626.1 DUF1592 domain-containing protein [Oceaniferula flavus]